jgi:hypothetical protein
MNVVIVYESRDGATRRVAEAVGGVLRRGGASVEVLPVGAVMADDVARADLLVVGGSTHRLGPEGRSVVASRRTGRRHPAQPAADGQTGEAFAVPDDELVVDLVAEDLPTVGPGLRRWFHGLPRSHGRVAAAFDTHAAGERGAAGVIARRLGRNGYRVVAAEGFVVSEATTAISEDELVRAARWGSDLVHQVASALPR